MTKDDGEKTAAIRKRIYKKEGSKAPEITPVWGKLLESHTSYVGFYESKDSSEIGFKQ